MQGQQSENSQTAITDSAGHFAIDHIAAGRYNLAVERTGYLPQQYGQDQPDKPGATLAVATGQKITDLIFRLQRTAVIAGRVFDEDGEPVPNVIVEVLLRSHLRKKMTMQSVGQATTNDLGEYRVFDLSPGEYSLRAASQPGRNMSGNGSTSPAAYAPSYYPGASEFARASMIDVKAGDAIPGIDFLLSAKGANRTYAIRGRVSNSVSGHPEAHIFVMAVPREAEQMEFDQNQNAQPNPRTGDFEIKSVAPGAYTIVGIWFDGGKMRGARQDVNVTGADVDGVSLVITNGADVLGRVSFEGKAGATADQITASLRPKDEQSMLGGGQQATVQPDGSFVLTGLSDGQYWIDVSSKCDVCYIKSATANGIDLLEKGIDVASGAAPSPIALVYSSNTGSVYGAVSNKDDLPAAGAYVIVVPEVASPRRPESTPSATTDQYGHFEIHGLPPGKYKAFAFDKQEVDAEDPDFLKSFQDKAESVELSSSGRQTLRLKMISTSDTNLQK
jgi:Carboxypeptidase regulatory-like domain